MKFLGLLLVSLLFISTAESHLNLYLNEHETMRLLGLSAELYYVRDGQVNEYALHFTVPVPANVRDIAFTWQSLAGKPLPYRINIASSDPVALPRPALNISRIGDIAQTVSTFKVDLRCSGTRAAEVEVTIAIEVSLSRSTNNVTELVFKRRKICLQGEVGVGEDDPQLLETLAQPPSATVTLIVGGALAILLVAILLTIARCARGSNKRQQPVRTSSFQRLQTHPSSLTASSIGATMTSQTSQPGDQLHRRIAEITVERCRVRLASLVQEGTFGRVYKGAYNEAQQVLVKTVHQHASQTQVALLLQEGMSLYGASHPNILAVLGVSIEDHTAPFLLYASEEHTSNLKLFLQEPSARSLTTIQIVQMAAQVASAIAHLHTHQVLHKDVATRNCVIDSNLCVKLTDNSLSRDLFPQDYNCLGDRENRPVKWMSFEALTRKQFTEASDVWSYGVFLWELCTLARQPYSDIDAFEMENYLRDGYRVVQPVNCPDELFTIMAYCWAIATTERPTLPQLQHCLQEFYAQLTRFV